MQSYTTGMWLLLGVLLRLRTMSNFNTVLSETHVCTGAGILKNTMLVERHKKYLRGND
jgi:hypothetical protein